MQTRLICLIGGLAVLLAGASGCGDGATTTDDGVHHYDLLILVDALGEDTPIAGDEGGRDHSFYVDEGAPVDNTQAKDTYHPIDNGGVDTNGGTDTSVTTDTGNPVDNGGGIDTNVPVDTGSGEDTNVPQDTTEPVDTYVPVCSGPCAYGTDKDWCDGTGTLCECGSGGLWSTTGCAAECAVDGLSGTCVTSAGVGDCKCSYDCSQAALVQTQCTDLVYTPCTCAASDPCGWQDDGYCDKLCEMVFSDDYFVEVDDCDCSGSCSTSTFAGFCDNDGGACSCSGSSMYSTDCDTYCTDMAAESSSPEWCYVYETSTETLEAACSCDNYDCDDYWGVDEQCYQMLYTPCTCSVDNPCDWIGDDYCDAPTCNELFPDQQNFDDNASDC